MKNTEIANTYLKALEAETSTRSKLQGHIRTINRVGDAYDPAAITAQLEVRTILGATDCPLIPSERTEWSDRLRNAEKYRV